MKAICLVATLLFTLVIPVENNASDERFIDFGLRTGISTHTEKRDFQSYELFGNYGLPWRWRTTLNWILGTGLNGSIGVLLQDGDTAPFSTLGPVIYISSPGRRVTFDAGGGFALIGEKEVGNHSFGGPFQFMAHGGLNYKFKWNVALGYRFFHVSDGGIFNGNGLNRHLLELSYRF